VTSAPASARASAQASVIDELHRRGLIALSTDEEALRAHLAEGPVTYYCGFDPTAPSLHVGHLIQFMVLRALQRAGHQPIVLVGGATGLVGDPRPTSERVLNDPAQVAGWVERIRRRVAPFLDEPAAEQGLRAPVYVDNLDWTAPLSAIDFLRDIGKHFRVNRMLAKEAVSARLESDAGISFTEFSYQILQGMDFLELHRRYGCVLQTGGSDQWGNLTAGVDLVRRAGGASVHALATPLITKADGTKFGKTETGTVWLDPAMTSPYAFYQFWLNADDRDIVGYLKVFSFRSREEIEELARSHAERPGAREAHRALAEELTALVHGEKARDQAVAASRALFGRGELGELDAGTLGAALTEAGAIEVREPVPGVAALLRDTGLVSSLSEGRRAVADGGAYVNNMRVTDPDATLDRAALLPGGWAVLRRGKRSVAGVRVLD
jgi:tyrosyl-tRNA synthetase